MKKPFVNIAIVGTGNGINAVLGLMFFTAVARTLSIQDFGKYALLTSILVSISKIMDFGTNSLFVAKSITKPQEYLKRFFSLKIILFLAALVVAVLSLSLLKLYTPTVLIIFFIGTLAYGINITFFAYFQRIEKFVSAVMLNTIPSIIKASFALAVFFGFFQPNLTQAFSVFSLSMLGSVLLTPLLPKEFLKITLSLKETKEFFMEAAPAGVSQVIKEGWHSIANALAKITNSFSSVGIFSLAHKLADIFLLISLSVFTVLLPQNARRKKNKQGYDLKETLLLAFGILVLAGIVMILANYLTVPVFGQKFEASVGLLNIMILAGAVTAMHTFMDNYFFVEEKTLALMKITIGKLAFFVTSSLILIRFYSLQGLAISYLLSAIFALFLTLTSIVRSK